MCLWFFGVLFLASTLNFGVLSLILPVIWAFAFFDAFNLRALSPEQRTHFRDEFIPNREFLHQYRLDRVFNKNNTSKIVAWALIIFGVLLLYNAVVNQFYWQIREYFPFVAVIVDSLLPVGIGIVVIFLGVRMLRGPKKEARADEPVPYEWEEEDE